MATIAVPAMRDQLVEEKNGLPCRCRSQWPVMFAGSIESDNARTGGQSAGGGLTQSIAPVGGVGGRTAVCRNIRRDRRPSVNLTPNGFPRALCNPVRLIFRARHFGAQPLVICRPLARMDCGDIAHDSRCVRAVCSRGMEYKKTRLGPRVVLPLSRWPLHLASTRTTPVARRTRAPFSHSV